MPGDYFFLNYGVQDGNVMQGLFRVEKTTLELQVYNGTQWVAVAGGGGSTSAKAMSTVQRMAFIPASGALIWDTDLERLFIGNSYTAGGIDTTDTNVKSLTTAQRMAIIPKQGELIWDTTLGVLFIGDGSTQGGVSIGGGGGSGIVAGIRLDFDGDTLNFNPVKGVENVTGNSVTFVPDTAYKIYATTGAFNVTANSPAANYWGLEGHAEIFVGSVGYVVFDTSKIVLANQLEPNSVNNCTLRFHDGMCYVSVEDHIAGYIVVNGSTAGDGSLYYGIATSTNDYVAFDASLNGQTIPLAGAVAEGEKHVVGNGYTETAITGAVNCATSKFTVANLALSDVQVTGGVMTLGDVFIPSGSTVAVSGGGLAVEKVVGDGTGVIDLGGTNVATISGNASANGCTFLNGSGYFGGVFYQTNGTLSIYNVNISGCSATNGGGVILSDGSSGHLHISGGTIIGNRATVGGGVTVNGSSYTALIEDSIVSGNSATFGKDIYVQFASVSFSGSTVGTTQLASAGVVTLSGTNRVDVIANRDGYSGTVTLASGAIVDLTGNTNATPIAPGGGVTFAPGGATVYPSAGQASAVTMSGGTFTAITNDGVLTAPFSVTRGETVAGNAVVNMNGNKSLNLSNKTDIVVSGLTLSGYVSGMDNIQGAVLVRENSSRNKLIDCTLTGNTHTNGYGGVLAMDYWSGVGVLTLSGCSIYENTGYYPIGINSSRTLFLEGGNVINDVIGLRNGGAVVFTGTNSINKIENVFSFAGGTVTISSGASINLANSINPGGTGGITVLTGGCTVNGNAIPAGTYTSIDSNGTPT